MFIGNDARTMMLMGVNKVADFVATTMGPGGKIVNIRIGHNNKLTKDGVTVAKNFVVQDPAEQVGVDFVYEAANKTVVEAGDGTTTTTVMTRSMMFEGHQRLALKKLNTNLIGKKLVHFAEIAIKHIEAQAIKVSMDTPEGLALLEQVGTISSNGDNQMAKMCLEAIMKVGTDPNNIAYTVAEYDEFDTLSFKEGMFIPSRVPAEVLGGAGTRTITRLSDTGRVAVMIVDALDQEFTLTKEIRDYITVVGNSGHGLLVVCKQPADNLKLLLNNDKKKYKTGYISPSLHGVRYTQLCEDLIMLTGADELKRSNADDIKVHVGYCETVEISADGMSIVGPQCQGSPEHLEAVELVKGMIKSETKEMTRQQLKDRLARLTGGVAMIRVTPTLDADAEERLDRYDDCVRAIITAANTGVVRGGGAAYLSAAYHLMNEYVDPLDQEAKIARDLIESALITPFNTITQNALNYIPKIDGRKLVNEPNLTVDVWTGEFVDAVKEGILDPLGVQTQSIRSAVKATAVFLNTGGMFQGRAPASF